MGDTDQAKSDQAKEAMLEAENHLLAEHGHLMDSPASNVEGLDRAACAGHATDLARLALGASVTGVGAEQWRSWIRDELGERGDVLLAAAEECMRTNGLWPWPKDM